VKYQYYFKQLQGMPKVKIKNTFFGLQHWQQKSNFANVFTMQMGSVSSRRQASNFYQILINIPYAQLKKICLFLINDHYGTKL